MKIENGIKCADERNWEEIEKDIMIAYQQKGFLYESLLRISYI